MECCRRSVPYSLVDIRNFAHGDRVKDVVSSHASMVCELQGCGLIFLVMTVFLLDPE